MSLKIAGFNVNSVRSRLPLLEAWFEQRGNDLDILCMQEIKAEEDKYPHDFFQRFGYKCYLNVQKRYNGVSVCSKMDVLDYTTTFNNPLLDEQKRLLHTDFEKFSLVNVYAPHGDLRGTDKFYYKLEWYDAFIDWIKNKFGDVKEKKIILTGDFNITMEDRDVYNPVALADTIGTMPEEREKLRALLELGFLDAFRMLHPDEIQYTWWDYKGAKIWKNEGMRIDYIFITPPLKDHLVDVEVDMWARRKNKIKPSDHAPVIGTFEGLD